MVENITSMLNNAKSYSETQHKSELGKDDFLQLMLAQLKYQDPLSPMDSSQYSAQLAQFSSLEQLQNMNKNLETSINANFQLTQSVNNTMTAALIGKDVKLEGNSFTYQGQKEFEFGYDLPAEASEIEVKIYNKYGKLVKTIENVEKDAGSHKLSWDFTDNEGKNVEYGDYSFEIAAKTSNGEEMTFDSYTLGKIQSVRYTESGTMLVINGVEYSLSQVFEIMNTVEEDT